MPSPGGKAAGFRRRPGGAPAYAELLSASSFSFLEGASHPEEIAAGAAALGLAGFAIADRNTLAGVVRGHLAARDAGIRFAVGCRLVFRDGTPDIAVWPAGRAAYGRLCRLLSAGNLRGRKGECLIDLPDLLEWGEGLEMAVLPGRRIGAAEGRSGLAGPLEATLAALAEAFPGHVRLGASCRYRGDDRRRIAQAAALAGRYGVPLLALGDVLYHAPERRRLQDVLTCIREHVTLENAGRRLEANAERHLKGGATMARLFADAPDAVAESVRLLERLAFSLDELRYEYPLESAGESATPFDELVRLAWLGAAERYPAGVPDKVKAAMEHEFALIRDLEYAPYFLTVWDIVRFARSQGILCQGRGSAANSAVCFALGITEVDPERGDLLFERFISPERREPPDIDVDFEHERREEVIRYIYEKYGRDRAAIAATVITYRGRSAAREVGKAFGLSADAVGALAGNLWGWSASGVDGEDARRAGLDPADRRIAQVLDLSRQIIGFPRHLSQHVGGFVMTRGRVDEVVPVLNSAMDGRTIIEWDKDDLDALGILKVDVLALGMLTCMRKGLDLLADHYGERLGLSAIPSEDPAVYDMICRADTIGVFQIESRAQMTMLPRLRPRTFYDLVIEVAIVRPGPIQGDMVHPYLRRRQGQEAVSYPRPAPEHGPPDELEKVLGKTLGVPLFQEQAMRIAIEAAKFTPGEADKLRRAMATFRRVGTIHTFQQKMVEGMVVRGYDRAFAEHCFHQIEGFGEYGFPESHAASFALLVYTSAWLKCHYPDVFCAALLNAQPMGFYAPAQIVRDAREHGVAVREVDVNRSHWDATLEAAREEAPPSGPLAPGSGRIHSRYAEQAAAIRTRCAVRLGFRQIKGIREADVARIVAGRGAGYLSVRDLWLRAGIGRAALERLAEADAFRSIGLDRRAALWQVKALDAAAPGHLPLFAREADAAGAEPEMTLPAMPAGEHVVNDYRAIGMSLKAHPVGFLRERLQAGGILPSASLPSLRSGRRVTVAGLVLVRQRPGSAKGVIFATLEDETGVANVIVWPKVFERYRALVLGARFLAVSGRLQSDQGVIHVVAEQVEDLTPLLAHLSDVPIGAGGMAHADEVRRPIADMAHKAKPHSRLARMLRDAPELLSDAEHLARTAASGMPKGRNFQ
ncbi:error-prone DNA polymerase [Faunimonas sp. B44]|uniref:error-prone DNA polymerase n=1 Tax=Faunimonas sp. B44 TaxID=3461493 RepID=UPI004044808C